ncbi:hypothetical protein J3R30DRAFT_3696142 [Lentinula aciculospora]|uniref:Uncharacterized protein n=1 Tax=Lentinula aciculospora TaxID=153920 RepID=A0A9W9ATP8_9AGAR|nr:hypothetical protein J3R30DRAFT_3696142 [Lentinula aciculospora]
MYYAYPSSPLNPSSPTSATSVYPPSSSMKPPRTVVFTKKTLGKQRSDTIQSTKLVVAAKPVTKIFFSLGPLYRLREHLPYGKGAPSPSPSPPSPPLRSAYLSNRCRRPQKNESRCLQYVMPGLFMAFEDDNISFGAPTHSHLPLEEELRTTNGQRFTHIIKLSSLKTPSQSPDIEYTVASYKTQVLSLGVFSNSHDLFDIRMCILASEADCAGLSTVAAQQLCTEYGDISEPYEGIPLLTPKQLLATREFICNSGYDLRRRQGARILITAPRDRCTDMVSVLVCYLAYASRNTAAMVSHAIDHQEVFLRIWKNTLSEHGTTMIQDVVNLRL